MPLALANRYANALADVVTKPSSPVKPADAVAQLHSFGALLGSSVELQNALTTPAVPASRKRAVVGRLAESMGLAQIIRNFLFVLIDHRRIAAVPEIVQSFELIVDERLGFARAEVISARELTEVQRAAVSSELEKLSGKRLRSRFTVDEALIGGLVARIGSTVYDGSVRGQLQMLQHKLAAEA
jgi:F-type H+-transporting ATPase subunit delta